MDNQPVWGCQPWVIEHVSRLNGKFVQDHDVGKPDLLNLQPSIPGAKWIWLGACGSQMFGCRAEEMPQFEAAAVLTTQTRERGVERHQGSGCSRGRSTCVACRNSSLVMSFQPCQ